MGDTDMQLPACFNLTLQLTLGARVASLMHEGRLGATAQVRTGQEAARYCSDGVEACGTSFHEDYMGRGVLTGKRRRMVSAWVLVCCLLHHAAAAPCCKRIVCNQDKRAGTS